MNLQRKYLFLIGCMGSRSMLVYLAKHASLWWLSVMGYLALLPAIGFFFIYFTNSRTTGPEVFGEKIWWNELRPIHGLLYLLFSFHAIQGHQSQAWPYLLVDVLLGLVSFLFYHHVVRGDLF